MTTRYKLPEQIDHVDPQKPLFDTTVQKGGYRICTDIAERNNIPSEKRQQWTKVNIGGVTKQYISSDFSNAAWQNDSNWQIENSFIDIIVSGGSITLGTATIKYNPTLDVVEIEYANGTTLQIGREQVSFVYNSTGTTISNGTPVYYSGVGGSGVQMPTIAEADASNLATAMVKGHATIDIPNESYGIIVCKGEMTVTGHGLTVGSKIYLGVGGSYVTTPPSNPNLTIELGIVLDANTLHVYPCIISPFTNSSTSLTSQLFLSNADSGISTFKNLSKVLDVAEITKTIIATNNTVAGEKYISEQLGITSIPAAVFLAHSTCKVSSTLGTSKIKFDVSLYHEDTTTTLLFSDESEDINFTVDTVIEFSVPFTAITCLATDRLLIELYFTATHTNPVTFTYYVGDGRATYITLPLPISHTDLSNLNINPDFQHVTGSQITSWNNKVDGPASSTNNTVPVFDGVTGKLLKGSSVSIVDNNMRPQLVTFKTPSELTGTNAMDFNLNQNWIVYLSGATTTITITPITSSAVFTCNIEVVQDSTGGRDLVLLDVDGKAIVNTQEFDFTTGGANERCFITIKYWLTGYRYLVDKYV